MRARVIVASTRAAAGVYEDVSGPVIRGQLTWHVRGIEIDREIVADGENVRTAIGRAIEDGVDVIVTTGGTGLTSTDRTPEMTHEFLDFEIPGIAEAIRNYGYRNGVPTAILSRGIAGVAGKTFIVNLAGSKGAAKDGMTVVGPILQHIVDQIHDGDH